MKQSTEMTTSSNWSWILDVLNSIVDAALSDEEKIVSLVIFKKLPTVALQQISSYLPSRYQPGAQKSLTNRGLMFALSPTLVTSNSIGYCKKIFY